MSHLELFTQIAGSHRDKTEGCSSNMCFFYLPDETYINLFYLHIFTHEKRKQRRTSRKNAICCYTKFNQKSDFVFLNCENTAANHLFTGTVSASSSSPSIHIYFNNSNVCLIPWQQCLIFISDSRQLTSTPALAPVNLYLSQV